MVSPTSILSPTASAPLCGSTPHDSADQEIAAFRLGLVLVDDPTHVEAPTEQLAVLGRERFQELLQSLGGGRPPSSWITFPSAHVTV
jgi:hypothetical protein